MMFVRISVCLGRACIVIIRVLLHYITDSSLWLNSQMVTLTPKHVYLLPAIFLQFHLEERWGMDVQTRRRIKC